MLVADAETMTGFYSPSEKAQQSLRPFQKEAEQHPGWLCLGHQSGFPDPSGSFQVPRSGFVCPNTAGSCKGTFFPKNTTWACEPCRFLRSQCAPEPCPGPAHTVPAPPTQFPRLYTPGPAHTLPTWPAPATLWPRPQAAQPPLNDPSQQRPCPCPTRLSGSLTVPALLAPRPRAPGTPGAANSSRPRARLGLRAAQDPQPAEDRGRLRPAGAPPPGKGRPTPAGLSSAPGPSLASAAPGSPRLRVRGWAPCGARV